MAKKSLELGLVDLLYCLGKEEPRGSSGNSRRVQPRTRPKHLGCHSAGMMNKIWPWTPLKGPLNPPLFLSWAPAALNHQPYSFPSRPLYRMLLVLPSSPSLTPPPHLCDLTFTYPPHLRLDVTPLVNEVFPDLPNLGGVSRTLCGILCQPMSLCHGSVLPQS